MVGILRRLVLSAAPVNHFGYTVDKGEYVVLVLHRVLAAQGLNHSPPLRRVGAQVGAHRRRRCRPQRA